MRIQSQVIIGSDIDSIVAKLKNSAQDDDRFIIIANESRFLMEDAALAIEKAYLSSKERVIIVLAAKSFSKEVQSKLLKILEEPPPNKEFVIIMPSKSMVLPTIRSRLPIVKFDTDSIDEIETGIDIESLDSAMVFKFVTENRYANSAELSAKIQKIFSEAMKSKSYQIDEKTLELFSDIIKALDRGSPSDFIASTALLKLLASKKR